MTELRYVRRFREWAAANGVGWNRLVYPRAPGGETVAYRFTPPVPPRGLVLAMHGAGNDALFAFVGTFKALLAHGFEIFSFDLDGHGRESTTRFGDESAPGAILAAVERSGARHRGLPIHALGVSLGGSLLLHSLPRLGASSAILLSAPLRIHLSWRSMLRELGPRVLGTAWRNREHFGLTGLIPSVGPFRRSVYPLRLAHPEPGAFGYVRVLNRTLANLRLEDAARRTSTPVLLLYGQRDLIAPAADGKRLAELLPHSELMLLPGETHLSAPLAPPATRALLEWLDRHADAAGPVGGSAGSPPLEPTR